MQIPHQKILFLAEVMNLLNPAHNTIIAKFKSRYLKTTSINLVVMFLL